MSYEDDKQKVVDALAAAEQGEAPGDTAEHKFSFYSPDSLADTVGWAVSTWYNRPTHIDAMRRRAMGEDHSWGRAAAEYARLYLTAYARRRGHRPVRTAVMATSLHELTKALGEIADGERHGVAFVDPEAPAESGLRGEPRPVLDAVDRQHDLLFHLSRAVRQPSAGPCRTAARRSGNRPTPSGLR